MGNNIVKKMDDNDLCFRKYSNHTISIEDLIAHLTSAVLTPDNLSSLCNSLSDRHVTDANYRDIIDIILLKELQRNNITIKDLACYNLRHSFNIFAGSPNNYSNNKAVIYDNLYCRSVHLNVITRDEALRFVNRMINNRFVDRLFTLSQFINDPVSGELYDRMDFFSDDRISNEQKLNLSLELMNPHMMIRYLSLVDDLSVLELDNDSKRFKLRLMLTMSMSDITENIYDVLEKNHRWTKDNIYSIYLGDCYVMTTLYGYLKVPKKDSTKNIVSLTSTNMNMYMRGLNSIVKFWGLPDNLDHFVAYGPIDQYIDGWTYLQERNDSIRAMTGIIESVVECLIKDYGYTLTRGDVILMLQYGYRMQKDLIGWMNQCSIPIDQEILNEMFINSTHPTDLKKMAMRTELIPSKEAINAFRNNHAAKKATDVIMQYKEHHKATLEDIYAILQQQGRLYSGFKNLMDVNPNLKLDAKCAQILINRTGQDSAKALKYVIDRLVDQERNS